MTSKESNKETKNELNPNPPIFTKYPISIGITFGITASLSFFWLPKQESMLYRYHNITRKNIFDYIDIGKIMASILIGSMATVYAGFAVKHGSVKGMLQESAFTVVFFGIATSLIKEYMDMSPEYIGIGIILHGVYDLLQCFKILPYTDHSPHWYTIACAVADVIMGSACFLIYKYKK